MDTVERCGIWANDVIVHSSLICPFRVGIVNPPQLSQAVTSERLWKPQNQQLLLESGTSAHIAVEDGKLSKLYSNEV